MSRRLFLKQSMRTGFGLLLLQAAGCSNNVPPTALNAPPRTASRNERTDHFDNLDPEQSLIGKSFVITLDDKSGRPEHVNVRFADAMTVIIDGNEHAMTSVRIGGKTLNRDECVPVVNEKVCDLITDVTPNEQNTGIVYRSEYGCAQIKQRDVKALFSALKYPTEENETDQSIEVSFELALTSDTQILVDGGKTVSRCVNLLSGNGDSSFSLPDSCVLHFKSTRSPEAETSTKPVQNQPEFNTERLKSWLQRTLGDSTKA